jgi:phage-related protein
MDGDGQASVSEAVALAGEFEAGSAFLARTRGGPFWIRASACAGRQETRGGQAVSGFGSAGVLEIVEDWDRSTYRAVYTVRFEKVVFVLHIFQKKSKRGASTPKADMDLIRKRLKVAEQVAKELSR